MSLRARRAIGTLCLAALLGCGGDKKDDPPKRRNRNTCGDGIRNGDDVCDGDDVGTRTCADEGFAGGGRLLCSVTCDAFVTTRCLTGTEGESCSLPIPIEASGELLGSTTDADADHTLSCGGNAPDKVYLFTIDSPSGLTVRASGYDTVIEVRRAPCESGAVVGCNDDEPGTPDVGSYLRIDVLEPGEYFLIVSGFVSSQGVATSGAFSLEVEILTGGYARCGDSTLQSALGELCDGTDVGGENCESFGWDGGVLVCNDVCRGFDFSGCTTTEVCSNGEVAGPELCDGAALEGMTCEALGFAGGELACADDCLGWDVSACTGTLGCGDGVRQGSEGCDGDAPPVFSEIEVIACSDIGMGAGALGCNDDCTLDTSGCGEPDLCAVEVGTGQNAVDGYHNGACDPCDRLGGTADPECTSLCGADGVCADAFSPLAGVYACQNAGFEDPDCGTCGNGLLEHTEVCDGAELGGATCGDLGYYAVGSLGCRPDCVFDVSACQWCGDGVMQQSEGELCDGDEVGLHTCEELGFEGGGTLRCNGVCRGFDTSGCVTTETCGNGSVAGPEVCDGDTLPESCDSLGFVGGSIACAGNCLSFDVSGCFGFSTCGDGVATYREICDGSHFNAAVVEELTGVATSTPTCVEFALDADTGAGTVGCNADCTIDISGCPASDLCLAYDYSEDEICDACELLGGGVDTFCVAVCQRDGVCADYYDPLIQRRTCLHAVGTDDPDCRRHCGDGRAGPEEDCDGDDLSMGSCEGLGFSGGVLACLPNCYYDTTACTP